MSENVERLRRGYAARGATPPSPPTAAPPTGAIGRRARSSGIELDESWAHLWTTREGLAVRLEVFSDRRAVLERFPAET